MTDLATVDLSATPFTWKTLTVIADTEMVPKGLRGNPPAMLAAIYLGRELGLGPMQAMNMIDVIDGKPSLSAELQTARIREAGHSMLCTELSDQAVSVKGTRRDNGDEMTITFTKEMATRAGLAHKRNWQQYPEAMLWARAVSMLARMLFADVFAAMHVYTPDELGDDRDLPTVDAIVETAANGTVKDAVRSSGVTAEAVGSVIDILDGEVVDSEAHPSVEMSPDPRDDIATREELEVRLQELLSERADEGLMIDVETRIRTMCRIAERLEVVAGRCDRDYLHAALADVGAKHVIELKRAELVRLAQSLQADIGDRFIRALASDPESEQ